MSQDHSVTKKPVFLYDNTTGALIREFESVSDISKFTGMSRRGISHVLNNRNGKLTLGRGYISFLKYDNFNKKTLSKDQPKREMASTHYEDAVEKYKEVISENKKVLEEISKVKKLEPYVLRTQLRQLKTQNENLDNINRRHIKEITELERKINFLEGVSSTEVKEQKWVLGKSLKSTREACVISLFSDLHAEERVTKEVTNGINEYNLDICKTRSQTYFRKFVKLTDKERKDIIINKAVIGLTGDNISGYIHEELKQNNQLSPTEAVLFVLELLYNGFKFLSDNGNFKKIDVICKCGNHGRNTAKKTFATGYKNNYEQMMYHILAQNLRVAGYNNINFIIENGEFTYTEIFGKTIRWCHGDHFAYRGGVGGIEIPLKTWLYKMNKQKPADMTYMGHWHDYIRTSDAVINQSVMGLNAYGLGFGFPVRPLCQHFELLDSERGFTINAPIWLV